MTFFLIAITTIFALAGWFTAVLFGVCVESGDEQSGGAAAFLFIVSAVFLIFAIIGAMAIGAA